MLWRRTIGTEANDNNDNDNTERPGHVPVLLDEVVEYLAPRPGDVVVDGTVGLGGHSTAILERIGSEGLLIGMDRDAEALEKARERLRSVGSPFFLFRGLFTQIREAATAAERSPDGGLDGILLDLGVSSYQIDTASRGFSFSNDGPLDMRMDSGGGQTAADWIARVSRRELERVLREYGEEPAAGRIARAIESGRARRPITTTGELARLVESVVPRGKRKIHPATRTFQAIRIQINEELTVLDSFLSQVDRYLVLGGRLVVLSYHSLEDRLVKRCLRTRGREGIFRVGRPEVIRPGEEEVRQNPRARSARLRWGIRGS